MFAVNLIEDIRQDAAVTWDANLPRVSKIFETIFDLYGVAAYLRQARGAH